MSLSLLKLVNSTNIAAYSIDHKLMVSGHSFLPIDAEYGLIEAASHKKQYIYIPEGWKETIMNTKRSCPKFDVIEVENSDIVSTSAME